MDSPTKTMTGQTLAPVAGSSPGTPGTDMTAEQYQSQVGGQYDELEKRLAAIPNVDYQKMMAPLLQSAQNRPIQNAPPAWAQALAAFGTGGPTPTIDRKVEDIHAAELKKDADIARIQEGIVSGQIDQEMQKGNFKKALEQSKMLQMLKPITDKYERQIALKDWTAKQDVLQKGKADLVAQRGALAKQLLTQKAREMAKGLGIDDRLLLAQVNNIARQQQIALQHAVTFDALQEKWVANDAVEQTTTDDATQQLATWIQAHKGGTGAAVTTTGATAPKSAADRIRAAAH